MSRKACDIPSISINYSHKKKKSTNPLSTYKSMDLFGISTLGNTIHTHKKTSTAECSGGETLTKAVTYDSMTTLYRTTKNRQIHRQTGVDKGGQGLGEKG